MKAKNKPKVMNKVLKVFLISMIIGIIAISTVVFSIYFSVKLDIDSFAHATASVEIYDAAGTRIDTPSTVDSYVSYDDISPHIIHAFVALEDKRFYKHNGIDYIRLAGALINNIKAGYSKEGGSTITQQLAKNSQLTLDKKISRKIKEARLAHELEKSFTKEEILEMYLNTIYFGNSLYGINEACQRFFGKQTSEVEPYEAAILAGVVNNPKSNSPIRNAENAEKRKNLVLRLMYEQEYLTDDEYNANLKMKYVEPQKPSSSVNYPYYNAAIGEASLLLGLSEKTILGGKYKISTYLHSDVQNSMHIAFSSGAYRSTNANGIDANSYAIMLDNATGGVTGYYADHSYSVHELRRQPGSALKPLLVYAPALNADYISPVTQFNDEKSVFNDYSPANFGNEYLGWIDARTALNKSSNVIAVQLLNEIGIEYAKSYAKKAGLTFSADDNSLALALGGMTYGLTATELAGGYMCIANGGSYTKPTFIREIRDENGKILYSHTKNAERVFSEESSYLLTDILMDTVKNGTARKMQALPFQLAAKTGTAGGNTDNSNTDAWSVSYTSQSTLCVWYGNLSGLKEHNITTTGGALPTLMAKFIYERSKHSPNAFSVPENIIELKIDKFALDEYHEVLLAGENTPEVYQKSEVFDIRNAPQEYSMLFSPPELDLSFSQSENGNPKITFNTSRLFTYHIYKRSSGANVEKLAEISEADGLYCHIDESKSDSPFDDLISWYGVEIYSKTGDKLGSEELPYLSLF